MGSKQRSAEIAAANRYPIASKSHFIDLCVYYSALCTSLSPARIGQLVPVGPRLGIGNDSLKVDDADKGYAGGSKERERLC